MSKTLLLHFCLAFFILHSKVQAQYVETIVSHPWIIDGLFLLNDTTLYTTPGAGRNINYLGIANPWTGDYEPQGIPGFLSGINIAQFNDSTLIVPCFDANAVRTLNQNTMQVADIATGLDGPAGVAVDFAGNAYIANYGAPPTLDATTIHKIQPNGQDSNFLDTSVFFQPQAIIVCPLNGKLYMCNSGGGQMWEIDTATGAFSLHTNIFGARLANIAWRNKDSLFYVTSDDFSHKIYQVDLQGIVTLFAGSTIGGTDGPLSVATFQRPLGVAFSRSEDTLYLAEGAGRLRRIVWNPPLTGLTESQDRILTRAFPNPVENDLMLDFEESDIPLSYSLYDGQSRVLEKGEFVTIRSRIDLRDLSPGTYFLRLQSQHRETTLRVLKQ